MHITIETLKENDKRLITLWQYEDELSGFNYALHEGGWIDCYCNSENSHCFVAKEGSGVIGLFFFIADNDNEFRILINPDYLNKGDGKLLTKKALEIGFATLNFKEISLIVRKTHSVAIAIYQKTGFTITGETEQVVNQQQIEFYKMVKRLEHYE